MNSRPKSIILFDHHIEINSGWLEKMNFQKHEFTILDPKKLFMKINWTIYEDDVQVINQIYSSLFEDVVICDKTLICFWPLHQQFGIDWIDWIDWIDLAVLCRENSYEIEISKGLPFEDTSCDFDETILTSWKKFVYFLIESLFGDIHMNKEFDEIAKLKSDNHTIILFKLEKEGMTRFSYTFDSDFLEWGISNTEDSNRIDSTIPFFDTFNELLEKLLKKNDLSHFEPHFGDKSLEKAYFNALLKKINTKNLIENWIKTYSMN